MTTDHRIRNLPLPPPRRHRITVENAAARFDVLDRVVGEALSTGPSPDPEVSYAWDRLQNSAHGRMGQALELLAAHPEAATALLTHRFPLERVADAFALLRSAQGLIGKVAIDLSRSTAATTTNRAATDVAEEHR